MFIQAGIDIDLLFYDFQNHHDVCFLELIILVIYNINYSYKNRLM